LRDRAVGEEYLYGSIDERAEGFHDIVCEAERVIPAVVKDT
jgi:hypothetical protein